jgi:hypothetical protein
MVRKREWLDEWRQIESGGGEEGKREDDTHDGSSEATRTEKNLRLAATHAAKWRVTHTHESAAAVIACPCEVTS